MKTCCSMLKKAMVAVCGGLCLTALGTPVTWHVDRASGDDAAAAKDDTGATYFQSIQAAVNKSSSGDTILVEPGVYDNVTGTDPKMSTNRVWISGKKLTLKSTQGAAKTHIVGRWDTGSCSTNGCGAMQIRCVCVNNDALGTVIEGFTLRDGATRLERTAAGKLNDDIPQFGGGLAVYSQKKEVYLVDCVISNCTACFGGAMRGGTAVRCLITRNSVFSSAAGARQANLYSCIVVRNYGHGMANCVNVANCTFAENANTFCGAENAYNCLFARSAANNATTSSGCVVESASGMQLFAPLAGDYRLLTGSVAATAGLESNLSAISDLPAEYVGKDFFGNAFPVESGKTVAGAVAEQVTPLYGGISFAAKLVYNGELVPAALGSYAFYNVWPQQVCVKPVPDAGKTFFRYKVTGASCGKGATSRWLQPDGTLWIVPPYAAGAVMTNSVINASKIIWADANYAGGDSDGTTNRPYATLKDAVAAVTDSSPTIIYAQEGDYNRGETWSDGLSNRVVIADGRHILLKAVGRVEKTILRGRAASPECQQMPEYYPGCGTNAVRCLRMGTVNSASAIQGFTIADGFSNCANYLKDVESDKCGGIYGPSSSNYALGQALDCVFTNCAAVRCGAMMGIWTSRCRMYDCHGYGGVTRMSILSSTYVDRSNEAVDRTSVPGATANYVVGTSTWCFHLSLDYPYGAQNRTCNNGYQLANVSQRWAVPKDVPFYGTVAGIDKGSDPLAFGYTFGNPVFVDADHGDMRQLSVSSCAFGGGKFADDGNAKYADAMTQYATFATTDMNGLPIRFKDGVPTPGAYQVPVAALVLNAKTQGSLAVNGSTEVFTNAMPATVTVSVENGTRPLTGFTVNGTEYAYDGSQSSWVFDASDYSAEDTFAVTPILGTNWYVSAEKPDDSGNGFTAATAKRTFHGDGGVMTNVKDGDTVHAGKGRYDEGYKVPIGFLRRRLVVPAGATVVADEGPEKTFIVGAAATETGVEGYEVNEYGLGTNAVACVYLSSTASKVATVRGFTLTGGRTHLYYGKGWSSGYWNDNCIGGAALALQSYNQAYNAHVEDCIVSNNVACRGGAFNAVNAINCRVFGNAASGGGCSANSFHQGCLVDGNRGDNSISNPRSVWNCTLGANNPNLSGSETCAVYGSYGVNGGVFNTLCLGCAQSITNANNSIFLKSANTNVDINDPRIIGCQLLTADEMPVDAAYAPTVVANPAVDNGDPTLAAHDWYGDHDVYGNPRAVNGGRMDIGAVETDWCPRYTKDISRHERFAVTSAGTNVVEREGRRVAIPDGETLSAKWVGNGKTGSYDLTVRLSESGTLTVTLNGEPFQEVSAVGETTLHFKNALAENALEFAYSGSGEAEILSSRCTCGAAFFIR